MVLEELPGQEAQWPLRKETGGWRGGKVSEVLPKAWGHICLQLAVWPYASGLSSLSSGFPEYKWGPFREEAQSDCSCSSLCSQGTLCYTSPSCSHAGTG